MNMMQMMQKAQSIQKKLQETQAQLAETLGISRSSLANTVRLLNLDPRVINLALDGKLTEGHCRSLIGIENPDKQFEMAKQIIENGDSVREIERKVKTKKR